MPRRKEPRIPDAVLDQLLGGADPKTVFEPHSLLDDLKKAFTERVLSAEVDHHLSGDEETGNSRNGYGRKTVITETGKLELAIPRDRHDIAPVVNAPERVAVAKRKLDLKKYFAVLFQSVDVIERDVPDSILIRLAEAA